MVAPIEMRLPSRGFQWRYLLLIPVATAVVHIIATFLAMNDVRGSAYKRLADKLPLNTMTLLPPIAPGHQPLPFLTTDARYSLCRFSTAKGPMTVTAVLPDLGWTLGIYHPDGTTAYFAAAASGHPTNVVLKIVPGDDRFLGLSAQAIGKATPQNVAQLNITARDGLIVVRAPDKGAPYRPGDEVVLSKASCVAEAF